MVIGTLNYTLLWVLDFLLPARRPNFAEFVHTRWKADQALDLYLYTFYTPVQNVGTRSHPNKITVNFAFMYVVLIYLNILSITSTL